MFTMYDRTIECLLLNEKWCIHGEVHVALRVEIRPGSSPPYLSAQRIGPCDHVSCQTYRETERGATRQLGAPVWGKNIFDSSGLSDNLRWVFARV